MERQRLDQLVHRVRWLDRYRRALALAMGVGASIALYVAVSAEWPHSPAVGLVLATSWAGWWLSEVLLAGLAAFWETEANEITRARGLPRAVVRAK